MEGALESTQLLLPLYLSPYTRLSGVFNHRSEFFQVIVGKVFDRVGMSPLYQPGLVLTELPTSVRIRRRFQARETPRRFLRFRKFAPKSETFADF